MRFRSHLLLSVCLAGAGAAACAPPAQPSEAEPQPAPRAPDMNAYWADHASHILHGDLEAATSMYAQDAVLVEPLIPPIQGREAIRSRLAKNYEAVAVNELSIRSTEVRSSGNFLVDVGTFSETISLKEQPEKSYKLAGNYVAVLEKTEGENWVIKRLQASPNHALPEELMQMLHAAGESDQ